MDAGAVAPIPEEDDVVVVGEDASDFDVSQAADKDMPASHVDGDYAQRPTSIIPQEELRAFSFIFSEDDLIPYNGSQQNGNALSLPPTSSPSEDGLAPTHHKSGTLSPDTRITVSQAILVSESRPLGQPKRSPEDAVEIFKSRRHSTAFGRTQNLTRSLSTLGRKSKTGLARSQTSKENTKDSDMAAAPVVRASTEPRKDVTSDDQTRRRSSSFFKKSSKEFNRRSALPANEVPPPPETIIISPPLNPSQVEDAVEHSLLPQSQGAPQSNEALVPKQEPPKKHTPSPLMSSIPSSSPSSGSVHAIAPLRGTVTADVWSLPQSSSSPRPTDELWSAFRSLDKDFLKFQSKAVPLKTDLVRTRLLPFLRSESTFSTTGIEPEDLERRIVILGKWWTALLDLLISKTKDQIPGYDQVFLVEAICELMERREWRTFPSPFCPVSRLSSNARKTFLQHPSNKPLGRDESDHVLESISHNIRNMYVQNLFSQIGLAVNKMVSRSAPKSFVNFAGKTCAYAFFFCPGVADILVRLWNIPSNNLKQMFKAYELNASRLDEERLETIVAHFPLCLQTLAVSSSTKLLYILKEKPVLPMGLEKIEWCGSWLSRWSGRDGDLFFIFVVAFHELVAEFLPPFTSEMERIYAPGLLLVHCQILSIVKGALQRPPGIGNTIQPLITFDDLLDPTSGASFASLDDNRIVRLLRKVLCGSDTPSSPQYIMFAEAFCVVFKAAAQSTSLYDCRACFIICDILQEAIPIFVQFQEQVLCEQPFLDCQFWIDVFKKMVRSENTMTELRLYSFLYMAWDDIVKMDSWRLALCADFLLDESHFNSRFNHWCPLLRSYYMRLLCWRIARFDGEESQENIYMLEMLMQNLQTVWSNFKYTLREADAKGVMTPTTTPANPAPGRRILLIRTGTSTTATSPQNQSTPPLIGIASLSNGNLDASASDPKSIDDKSSLTPFFGRFAATFDFGLVKESAQKQGNLLRSVLGYRTPESRSRSRSPREASPSRTNDQPARRNQSPRRTSAFRASLYEHRPNLSSLPNDEDEITKQSSQGRTDESPDDVEYTTANFKFSLELADRHSHNINVEMQLSPPRLPREAQNLLESRDWFSHDVAAFEPLGAAAQVATYTGRALAEWTLVVNECQNFIERRRKEGVPTDRLVETPTLGVEALRRPV